MKNPQESLYPNRSGTPKDAQDSSLVHWILGVFFFTNCQNLDSGFTVTLYIICNINVTKNVSYFAKQTVIWYKYAIMQTIIPRKRGRPPTLTMKQKKFAELYVFERGKKTQTQCAFEAGYKNRAAVTASELTNPRKFPLVCDYITKLEKEQENRFRITKSLHMQDLAKGYHQGMEQPSTYSTAIRAEELRGKVMGYYVNRNENKNINATLDDMTKEDLMKEFSSFYEEKIKDVTPTKDSKESKEESNLDSDSKEK